ncbi:MAG: hypothetical protein A4E40_00739 [Methanoregulaceae archaeon PtaU1.Bin059]|nr:MAG: hypothetical protein A4E40_00739 [Methanoregulaceae archaeon PtaU1.Bin059]
MTTPRAKMITIAMIRKIVISVSITAIGSFHLFHDDMDPFRGFYPHPGTRGDLT